MLVNQKSRIGHFFLQNFRNYSFLDLCIQDDIVVFTGDNGTGKTNILEALSMFSPGKGLRGAKLSNLIRHNAPLLKHTDTTSHELYISPQQGWSLSLDFHQGQTPTTSLQTNFIKESGKSEKRRISADGDPIHQKDLLKYLSCIWLTPQMSHIFIDSAGEKRRFFDKLMVGLEPDMASSLHRYHHYLDQRSHLLTSYQTYDVKWLEQLESFLAKESITILKKRQSLAHQLNQAQRESVFPHFSIHWENEILSDLLEGGDDNAYQLLTDSYKKSRELDKQRGGSRIGAHRSDAIVVHERKQMEASLCSTGEQRILLVGILLAFSRLHPPTTLTLLLLDDVLSYLDSEHRRALFEELVMLKQKPFQIFLTGTDPFPFQDLSLDAQFFSTKDFNPLS